MAMISPLAGGAASQLLPGGGGGLSIGAPFMPPTGMPVHGVPVIPGGGRVNGGSYPGSGPFRPGSPAGMHPGLPGGVLQTFGPGGQPGLFGGNPPHAPLPGGGGGFDPTNPVHVGILQHLLGGGGFGGGMFGGHPPIAHPGSGTARVPGGEFHGPVGRHVPIQPLSVRRGGPARG